MADGFDSLAISPALRAVVAKLGYESLTPIQEQGIPVLLEGKDLVGQSKTGSGKTAAFALPILQSLKLDNRVLQAVVLCPTRELCGQVAREFRKLGRRHPGLAVLTVCGGEPGRPQAEALGRGVHVVVGTPGRVLDHLGRKTLRLGTVRTLVLDEADRMLDMGFEEDMEKILAEMPKQRQTALFSATFPRSIHAMSGRFQTDPVRVTIEEPAEEDGQIQQAVLIVDAAQKFDALASVLATHPHESALVFCNLKSSVREIAGKLSEAGVVTEALHGDLEQFHRDRVMAMFRNQSVRVLVATDVAARGIDVADLELVVNFDLPHSPEVYVHRIGRTGRAGALGISVSLVTPGEKRKLRDVEHHVGASIERIKREPESAATLLGRIAGDAKMAMLQISGGRKDKVRPGDILGALTGEAGGLDAGEVGKIEIHDRWSYVAVSSEKGRHALRGLNAGKIKGRRFRASLIPPQQHT
ncbi:MAG: ATP-dependent RNA helicase DbpA [Nannocystales bacterium]